MSTIKRQGRGRAWPLSWIASLFFPLLGLDEMYGGDSRPLILHILDLVPARFWHLFICRITIIM